MRLLSVLSIGTGLQSNLTGLQERTPLLTTCVGLLKVLLCLVKKDPGPMLL